MMQTHNHLDTQEIAQAMHNVVLHDGALRASPCDSARITFFPRSTELRATLAAMCDDVRSALPDDIDMYRVSPKDYHVDVFTMYGVAPIDMADRGAHAVVMPLEILYDAGAYIERAIVASGISTFPLTLMGLHIGRDGSIVAAFCDDGQTVALRRALGDIMQKFTHKEKQYDHGASNEQIHMTIAQIVTPAASFETSAQKLYDVYEKYQDMAVEDICTVKSVLFGHETRWMMEEYTLLEEYRLH